jgi:leucyl/phenylalanyl-tRNA--protein transferase
MTWLLDEMQQAYKELHELGFAHSVEAWEDDELVGGLYGVALNRFFFGESMFHHRSNASKVILAQLARHLDREGFLLLDCQVPNQHLRSMGARDIPREDFLDLLDRGGLGPGGSVARVVMPGSL